MCGSISTPIEDVGLGTELYRIVNYGTVRIDMSDSRVKPLLDIVWRSFTAICAAPIRVRGVAVASTRLRNPRYHSFLRFAAHVARSPAQCCLSGFIRDGLRIPVYVNHHRLAGCSVPTRMDCEFQPRFYLSSRRLPGSLSLSAGCPALSPRYRRFQRMNLFAATPVTNAFMCRLCGILNVSQRIKVMHIPFGMTIAPVSVSNTRAISLCRLGGFVIL